MFGVSNWEEKLSSLTFMKMWSQKFQIHLNKHRVGDALIRSSNRDRELKKIRGLDHLHVSLNHSHATLNPLWPKVAQAEFVLSTGSFISASYIITIK